MKYLFLAALLSSISSCDTSEPPPSGEPSVQFAAVDASCTEVWLQVKLLPGVPQRTIRIQRDSTTIFNTTITASDTLIVDEGLSPNRSYGYTLLRATTFGNEAVTSSIRTLDTTSHNFTWQSDTLGDGSSILYDVALINDTLAYAVGAIYLRDSLGNWDPNAYNLVKWDGTGWELMKIQFYTFCDQAGTGSYPAKSIFAFSPTDVWIGMDGSQVVRWNGQSQSAPMCTPVSINRLWGENSNSVYAVGNGGGIAHYSSGTWSRLGSGTTVDIRDVWGSPNGSVIWACGYANDYSRSVLLQGIEQQWRVVVEVPSIAPPHPDSLSGSMASVWTMNTKDVEVATSGGIYRVQRTSVGNAHRLWYPGPNTIGFFHRVRGNARNDIFVAGAFGTLVHFNGVSWRVYEQFIDFTSGVNLFSVEAAQNSVIAVGYKSGRAFVIVGRR